MSHRIIIADVMDGLRQLDNESVQCIVTSPPYWNLRNYGVDGQIGLEPTISEYVEKMRDVFRECKRVLRNDGTLWLNLGSSYVSSGTLPSRSRDGVRSCDTNGKELLSCPALDYACSGLCDEHLADLLNHYRHNDCTVQQHQQSPSRDVPIAHDSGPSGYALASLPAEPLCAHLSTTIESWLQLRGECLRCDSRVSSLCESGSSYLDVQASERMASYRNGILERASACRKKGRGAVDLAYSTTEYLKEKDDAGIPWAVAFALRADGWYLRKDIIWSKANPMPESVRDRPTSAHEYIFLLTKNPRYFYDADAIAEPAGEYEFERQDVIPIGIPGEHHKRGRTNGTVGGGNGTKNARSVWTIATEPYSGSHYAVFPSELPRRCILAGSKAGDTILDPFAGSGTTIQVAIELGRDVIGIDLDERNRALIEQRILGTTPPLEGIA